MFLRLDKNNDGILSKEELREGKAEILTFFNIEEEELNDMVRSLDPNGEDVINYQELITKAFTESSTLSEQNLNSTFKIFDTDDKGEISKGELMEIFEARQIS